MITYCHRGVLLCAHHKYCHCEYGNFLCRTEQASVICHLCTYGHRWSPSAEFLRTSCKQEPTSRIQTSSCYSGFQSDSLEIFRNISLSVPSQKFGFIFILSLLSTFLGQSPEYIHIYIYIYIEFLYCGMLSCHGKIFRRETIMILCVIVLYIKKIALACLQRFLLKFFIKF